MAKQYALIIGVNNYHDFPEIKKAEADAKAVADALQSGVLGEFDSIETIVDGATAQKSGIALKRFLQTLRSARMIYCCYFLQVTAIVIHLMKSCILH